VLSEGNSGGALLLRALLVVLGPLVEVFGNLALLYEGDFADFSVIAFVEEVIECDEFLLISGDLESLD
jgi:hypothetical protein